jgi:hypothetical protein
MGDCSYCEAMWAVTTITESSRHTPASPPRSRNVGYGRAVTLAELRHPVVALEMSKVQSCRLEIGREEGSDWFCL